MRYFYRSGTPMTRHAIVQSLLFIDTIGHARILETMGFHAVFAWLAVRFAL